jgi:nitrous oxidase accessory protein NosD
VRVLIALLLAALASWASRAAVAEAANCGGERPCACGDKVVEDYRLPADLGPCPKTGLRLGPRVTLDGGGHAVRGPGTTGVGVRIGDDASGSRVSHLVVTGFLHGIRLVGARDVRIADVEAHGNGDPGEREGYGIDVASAASGNVLERVRVHHNADEGIHVGTDAAGNRIADAQVHDNGRENVYFLACRDNRLERSTVRAPGSGNASVYVKFASGTVLEGNTIEGGPVQIRGGSSGTTLSGNTIRDGGVVLQDQDDRRFGSGAPSATTIRGGSIASSGACVRVEAGTGTRIEDVTLACRDGIRVARGVRIAIRPSSSGEPQVRCAGDERCFERLGDGAAPPAAR